MKPAGNDDLFAVPGGGQLAELRILEQDLTRHPIRVDRHLLIFRSPTTKPHAPVFRWALLPHLRGWPPYTPTREPGRTLTTPAMAPMD
jgi:hypothetical protein